MYIVLLVHVACAWRGDYCVYGLHSQWERRRRFGISSNIGREWHFVALLGRRYEMEWVV